MKKFLSLFLLILSFSAFSQTSFMKELNATKWKDQSKVEYKFTKEKLVFGQGKYQNSYKITKIIDSKRLLICEATHPKTKKKMFIPIYWNEPKDNKTGISNFGLTLPLNSLKEAEKATKPIEPFLELTK
jgi:hypothetical protein